MVARFTSASICLLLVMMLAVSGCNRGGDTGPTEGASPSAASAAPAPSPSPSPQAETYTVRSGDTLSQIAQRFDTTVQAIVEANDLDDPDVLGVGDELIIPPAQPSERPRRRPSESGS
jgi:LysM repeat protein